MKITPENADYCDRLVAAAPELSINFDIWHAYQQIYARYHTLFDNLPDVDIVHGGATKAIWWCWLQGLDDAPPICRACFDSLVRNMSDEYQLFVVTEANYRELVTFPPYIEQKYREGKISRAHFSDLLRLALLTKYGGVWIDATVYCSEDAGAFFAKQPLFAYQHINRGCPCIPASNWLIASLPHHPILEATQLLLHRYWQENDAAINYFIFHLFWNMAVQKYKTLWGFMPSFSNVPPSLLYRELILPYSDERRQQFFRMSRFHKLTYKIDDIPKDWIPGSFYEWILGQRA